MKSEQSEKRLRQAGNTKQLTRCSNLTVKSDQGQARQMWCQRLCSEARVSKIEQAIEQDGESRRDQLAEKKLKRTALAGGDAVDKKRVEKEE